ncbi:MAG: YtxH domain-containing protein [Thermaerobacter sp.]|nr:YtxH domain-containing protein [Thermaerobacter sp.]
MNDKTWDRLSGLLVGAAVGFVAGILLAPSKGAETRESIKKRTQGTIDQFAGGVRDVRSQLVQKGQDLWRRSVTEIPVETEQGKGEGEGEDEGQGA